MEIINVHFQQNLSLQKIVQTFPPVSQEQFEQWLKTSVCEDWEYKWRYLKTLNIDSYLRMYAQLPALLINKHPEAGSAEYQLFGKYQERYLASSIWLKQLLDYGAPNYKEIYESQAMNLYRHDANFRMAELDLCRAVVRHPRYKLNQTFGTPIYLWFWVQVASCLKYFKNNGLTAAIAIEEIQTKREVYQQWGKLLDYYQEGGAVPTTNCESIPDFLLNLPAILPGMAQKIIREKYDLMLDGALQNYLNAAAANRMFGRECSEIQVACVYKTKSKAKSKLKNELFVSGLKQKRPKC
ncbi:MAG: hypothetical protein KME38_24045 [Spirirestis rafaelensis WJT71-NPBG6]|jgi:hypothetical protein|nr:hypothetical protein [Spirirestis rafaelensis WJT71-NPBG6]